MRMPALLGRLVGSRDPTPHRVYGALVAQARLPAFYADLGVPDTLEGRYDMIMLHAFLLFERLNRSEEEREFAQDVFDAMFTDLDRSLREMGVGDLSVPKRINRMAGAFYGRAEAYEAACKAGSRSMMTEAVARNLYAEGTLDTRAAAVADYAFAARERLSGLDFAEIRSGNLDFPAPVAAEASP